MYNQPYFIPNYYSTMATPNMMRGALGSSLLGAKGAGRGIGLMSRLGSGFSAIKSLNWGGFINNASKTLGVINQTIPLVRQVGPMVNNMKSMLRVASVFKDETDRKPNTKRNRQTSYPNPNYSKKNSPYNNQKQFYSPKSNSYQEPSSLTKEEENNSTTSPTFFID